MNRALLLAAFFLTVLAVSTRADDWQDTLTTKAGAFPPLRPFHAHYRFGWTMFTAAEADFDYSRKKEIARLAVTARTIGAVRSMWRMDTEHIAKMHAATLRPISLSQTEIYKGQTDKTKVDFTPTGVSRLRESKPASGPPKNKTFDYPDVFDLHSAVHFVRSQKLDPGDTYRVVVYPATAPYLAEVEVLGRQKIKAAGRTYLALKLALHLWKIDKDLTLQAHEKFKRAALWISDDADRLLLRVEAEIAVGAVWGELDRLDWRK